MLKLKLTPLCIAICLTTTLTSNAFADDAAAEKLIQKINERTMALEAEIKSLKAELAKVKKEQKVKTKVIYKSEPAPKPVLVSKTVEVVSPVPYPIIKEKMDVSTDILFKLGAMPVVTAPYIGTSGLQPGESGHIVSYAGYNQDYHLLRQEQRLDQAFNRAGLPGLTDPILSLSGKIVGEIAGARQTGKGSSSDINVDTAELDVATRAGDWATGFMALKFDNSFSGPTRTSNSRLFVEKAFVTIGNLEKTPFYLTIGQKFVPFGQYNNFMVTGPMNRRLGRVLARQISVSYASPITESGLYATLFAFRGDIQTSHINNGGGTVGYIFRGDKFRFDMGVDYISNIADSQGMQDNGVPFNGNFRGFGATPSAPGFNPEALAKRVPGIDVHADLTLGDYRFIAEYTGATTSFSPLNMTFNGVGARPQAVNLLFAYNFKSWCKDSNIALNYGQTSQALALNLPQRRWAIAYNISPWRNTLLSLELRRDQLYPSTNIATGQGLLFPVAFSGGYVNALTAQFGMYF